MYTANQQTALRALRAAIKSGAIKKSDVLLDLFADAPTKTAAACPPKSRLRLNSADGATRSLAEAVAAELRPGLAIISHANARGSREDPGQMVADLISDDRSPFTPDDEMSLRSMSIETLRAQRDRYLGDDEEVEAMTSHQRIRDRMYRGHNHGRVHFRDEPTGVRANYVPTVHDLAGVARSRTDSPLTTDDDEAVRAMDVNSTTAVIRTQMQEAAAERKKRNGRGGQTMSAQRAARERDWNAVLDRARGAGEHPYLTAALGGGVIRGNEVDDGEVFEDHQALISQQVREQMAQSSAKGKRTRAA